jgi:transposase-like protein
VIGRPKIIVDSAAIVKLYQSGLSIAGVANELGVSSGTIARRLKPFGIARDCGSANRGKKFSEDHRKHMREAQARKIAHWDLASAIDLYRSGMSAREAGGAFGISESAMLRHLKKLGIVRHQAPQDPIGGFWKRVNRSEGCWNWTGPINGAGYGSLKIGKKPTYLAHRYCWLITYGPIPPRICVMHICDNKLCVRPDHLMLGTHQDNTMDMIRKGRNRKQITAESAVTD